MTPAFLGASLADASGEITAIATSALARQRRVMVATEDVSLAARTAVLATQAAGGRAITLEHGVSGLYLEQVHSVADILGTWGRSQADYHAQAGNPTQRRATVGWAHLAGRHPAARERADHDAIFFGQPVPSVSASNWPQDAMAAAALVGACARAHPEWRIAWKPHPASRAYGGGHDPGPPVGRLKGASLELIPRARVVVTATSSTAIEAMVLGRPVIQIVGSAVAGGPDLVAASGATIRVSTLKQLEDAMRQMLQDDGARERHVAAGLAYARDFISGLDEPGRAERTLSGLIRELADGLA